MLVIMLSITQSRSGETGMLAVGRARLQTVCAAHDPRSRHWQWARPAAQQHVTYCTAAGGGSGCAVGACTSGCTTEACASGCAVGACTGACAAAACARGCGFESGVEDGAGGGGLGEPGGGGLDVARARSMTLRATGTDADEVVQMLLSRHHNKLPRRQQWWHASSSRRPGSQLREGS